MRQSVEYITEKVLLTQKLSLQQPVDAEEALSAMNKLLKEYRDELAAIQDVGSILGYLARKHYNSVNIQCILYILVHYNSLHFCIMTAIYGATLEFAA